MAKYRKPLNAEQLNGNMDNYLDSERYPLDNRPYGCDPLCENCGMDMSKHERIKTANGWQLVCPGNRIIAGIQGKKYPCFWKTYEAD